MNVPPSRKAKVYVVCEDEKLCEGFEELTTCACPLMSASELAVQADKAGIAAVSYTHLDVYKRQVQYLQYGYRYGCRCR